MCSVNPWFVVWSLLFVWTLVCIVKKWAKERVAGWPDEAEVDSWAAMWVTLFVTAGGAIYSGFNWWQ